jgi:flagellar biosynthesis protein FlhG
MSLDQQAVLLKHREGEGIKTRYMAIASGKGGVGKTLLSINIGKCLSDSGSKVLIIDADFGLSNIHLMLGINPEKNLSDFFYGRAEFKDILVKIKDNLCFISSGNGIYELARLPGHQILNLVRRLQELSEDNYDWVIFDTPPGIHEDTLMVTSAVDIPVILTTPEPTAVADAYALIKILNKESDVKSFYLLVNKVEGYREAEKVYESIQLLVNKFTTAKLNFAGSIRYRKNIIRKIINQDPFDRALMEDVYNILKNMPLDVKLKEESFWQRILSKIIRR